MSKNVSAEQTKRLIEWFTYYGGESGFVESTAEMYVEYLRSVQDTLTRALCLPDVPQENDLKLALECVLEMQDGLKTLLPEDVDHGEKN